MKRFICVWGALALFAALAAGATAQNTARLDGEVRDLEGKLWPDVSVEIKSDSTGTVYAVKTDKKGQFSQSGLAPGAYTITLKKEQVNYSFQKQIRVTEDNTLLVNFKEIAAKQGINVEEAKKKQEEEEQKFQNMKEHFDAGVAAIKDASALRSQLLSAPAVARGPIQEKMKANYETAIVEFQQADKAANSKDPENHSMILANLGVAYESAGRYDEAVASWQKAIDLKPQPSYFVALATDLAKEGKYAEASPNCEKAAALDTVNSMATATMCWRNLGIVLSNAGKMKEAVELLQKVVKSNPKDAEAWFLLGGALAGTIDTKQEGDKMIYIIPPGTLEAYQKYLELAPNGPRAAEANAMLQALASYQQGAETKVSTKKKK